MHFTCIFNPNLFTAAYGRICYLGHHLCLPQTAQLEDDFKEVTGRQIDIILSRFSQHLQHSNNSIYNYVSMIVSVLLAMYSIQQQFYMFIKFGTVCLKHYKKNLICWGRCLSYLMSRLCFIVLFAFIFLSCLFCLKHS